MDRCQHPGNFVLHYGPLLLWICWYQGDLSLQGQEALPLAHNPSEQIKRLKQQEIAVLQELVRDCPDHLDAQILLAKALYRHGQGSEAVRTWKAILKQHPERTEVCDLLGTAALKKGQYEQAIAYWQQALQVNPKLPNAHSSIAKALLALGRPEEAIAAFQKEIEISPKSALNHFLLAQQRLQCNQWARAKQHYERALALNPKLINAHYGLFQAHSRLQEHKQAQQHLKTFKQLKTQKQQARTESILAFDDLTKTKQDTAQTYALVGKTYLVNRMFNKAETPLKQALALCPGRSDYAKLLAIYHRVLENQRNKGITK